MESSREIRQFDGENRAFAWRAFDPDIPSMGFDDRPCDGKAKTGVFRVGSGSVATVEPVEDVGKVIGGDAFT